MAAAASTHSAVSFSSACRAGIFSSGTSRPNLHSAAAWAPGWRRREPYPAVSVAAGSAQSAPGDVAVDTKIIYIGKPDGPTCHTGAETCYYTSVYDALRSSKPNEGRQVVTTLCSLEDTISRRQDEIVTEGGGKPSWTKKLLLDNQLLCSKIREEAGELIQTLLENQDRSRAASEMADLLYHAMVLLRVKDVKMGEVLEVLRKRFFAVWYRGEG